MAFVLSCILLALVPLVPTGAFVRILRAKVAVPRGYLLYCLFAGLLASAVCFFVERWFWELTGLSLSASQVGIASSVLAMLVFAAPLEEGAKLAVVWPMYNLRVLAGPRSGMLIGAVSGAGFAVGQTFTLLVEPGAGYVELLRSVVASVAHPFFAALWGYVLGGRTSTRWFSVTWFASAMFHGLYNHIVLGRGAGFVGAALPLAIAMLAATYWVARAVWRAAPTQEGLSGEGVAFSDASFGEIGFALRAPRKPASLVWGLFGALVTIGVVLSSVALGVYIGHRLGIDFAAASEDDVRSNGPIVLLGVSAVAGFPVAGYLVAKASSARSVLEPALGAILAIGAVAVGTYVAAPIAVVFIIAAAPVAFFLACAGAWFGIER